METFAIDALSSAPTHGVTDAHFVYNVTGGAGEKARNPTSRLCESIRLRGYHLSSSRTLYVRITGSDGIEDEHCTSFAVSRVP